MIRRALIVYCDNTYSGALPGPEKDKDNFVRFLKTNLGGQWYDDEIKSLRNPTKIQLQQAIDIFLSGADYTFTIFSGHGCINTSHNNLQYCELSDGEVSINKFKTNAKRQTLIIDSCRGLEAFESSEIIKSILETKMFTKGLSTRHIFESETMSCEVGWSILYSASEDESSRDSKDGGVYLLSLLAVAELWGEKFNSELSLPLDKAHELATKYLKENFPTIQQPFIEPEKRLKFFPFAVKNKRLIS